MAFSRRVSGAVAAVVLVGVAGAGFLAGGPAAQAPGSSGAPKTDTPGGPEPLIDLSEIDTLLQPDAIPPIDDPRFQTARKIEWLSDREPVMSFRIEGEARAYPLQIMTWHEIVNDEVGGVPVTVTFCPLCNTALAYKRPEVKGSVTTFGTSGKLYNSNLVMYDRATKSYWPQVTGQAVAGPLTGRRLERLPIQIVSWGEFRSSFPTADVLSRETGFDRPYGQNPYPGYDDVDRPPFAFRGEVDGRLAAVERTLGIQQGEDTVAFPYFRLEKAADNGVAAINATVGDEPVVVLWKKGTASALDDADIASSRDVGAAAAFSRSFDGRVVSFEAAGGRVTDVKTNSTWNLFGAATNGPLKGEQLEAVDSIDSLWFDWAAFHPDTQVWPGPGK